MSRHRRLRAAGPWTVVASLVLAVWAAPVVAQADPPPPQPASPQPAADADLEDRVEELEDAVEDQRADIDDLYQQQNTPRAEPVRLNLLNPQITVFANLAARVDSDDVVSPEGAAIDNKAFLRSAEIDFRAAIDPYADGVVILAIEDEAGDGFAAELEEAYLVLKRLPIVEAAPLGLKLKLGRFRAPLGSINRMHLHDMPWTTRPLPITEMLGTEHGSFFESGFNPVGADAELLLPTIIDGAVMELNLDVINAGGLPLTSTNDGRQPAVLGRYNLFFTPADGHDVNLGLSAYYEGGDHRVALYAADVLYKWKPHARGEFRSFVLGGEVFYADRRFAVDTDGDGEPDADDHTMPLAAFGFAQYQLTWHTYLGARYDFVQHIDDDAITTHVFAGYLSYYTSEFLRLRVGYEYRRSDVEVEDGVSTGLVEVNWVFGSHPTEPYWVNR